MDALLLVVEILQQPTVHHQLDLTVSYAAGAGLRDGDLKKRSRQPAPLEKLLGDIREDCELGSRVPETLRAERERPQAKQALRYITAEA